MDGEVSKGIRELIEEAEANLQKMKLDHKILKEQLKVAEFERDIWQRVAQGKLLGRGYEQ